MVIRRVASFMSRNVFANLAAEERYFDRTSGHSLIFYVNSPCVVMGRFQNPFKEADVAYASSHRIPIARRKSGGGTVVHDEGNLNVCFMRPRDEHDPCANSKLLAKVLHDEFGIPATVDKRADIRVDGLKVSGSAYRISRNRAYHHATLLVNSDLQLLRRLLASPLKDQLEAKGTPSVPSSVVNLSECGDGNIDIPTVMQAIADRWKEDGHARIQSLSPDVLEREFGGFQEERSEFRDHSWVYGQTPQFSFVGEHDGLSVEFSMDKGTVVSGVTLHKANGDGHHTDLSDVQSTVNEALCGRQFDGPSLIAAMDSCLPEVANHEVIQAVRAVLGQVPHREWPSEKSNDSIISNWVKDSNEHWNS